MRRRSFVALIAAAAVPALAWPRQGGGAFRWQFEHPCPAVAFQLLGGNRGPGKDGTNPCSQHIQINRFEEVIIGPQRFSVANIAGQTAGADEDKGDQGQIRFG